MDRLLGGLAVLVCVLAILVAVLAAKIASVEATFEKSVAETSWRLSDVEKHIDALMEEADASDRP